jgi:hypothetical protein
MLTILGSRKFERAAVWISKARVAGSPRSSATSYLGSEVNGADVIIGLTGGNSQAVMARSLAPLLRDGPVILLIRGNTGGSLIVRRALDDAGCHADVDVAEMDNYPVFMLAVSWMKGFASREHGGPGCRRVTPTGDLNMLNF